MGCGSSSSAKGTVDKAKAPGGVVPSVIPGPLPQLTKENLDKCVPGDATFETKARAFVLRCAARPPKKAASLPRARRCADQWRRCARFFDFLRSRYFMCLSTCHSCMYMK